MLQSAHETQTVRPPVVEVVSDTTQIKPAKRPCLTTTGAGDIPLADRQVKKRKLYQELTQALEWKQKSAAYKALCIQTFAFAERALEQKLAKLTPNSDETVGLVLDVDDCLLECSPFFGGMVDTDEQMSEDRSIVWWRDGQREMSTVIAGALEFVKKYADDKRVKITFLTSRTQHPKLKQWTLDTLQHFGFPAKDDNLIIAHREKGHSKPDHIQKIRESNKEILTMGDKLSDAGDKMPDGPAAWVHTPDTMRKLGRDHIVVPNSLYGHWEGITHKAGFDIEEETKARLNKLKKSSIDLDGTPEEDKAREALQNLHYMQSASFEAYMIQLTNIVNDILDEYDGKPEEAGAITDIDGTLLSNDRFMATLFANGRFTPSGNAQSQWTQKETGHSIIGMQPVMKKLHERKIKTCYVTNRPRRVKPDDAEETFRAHTRKELTQKKLMEEGDLLLMKEDSNPANDSGKSSRFTEARKALCTNGPLSLELMFGDAMNDLDIDPVDMHDGTFESWPEELKKQLKTLGKTRFLLPNPLYVAGWKSQLARWEKEQENKRTQGKPAPDPIQLRKIRCWCPEAANIPTVVAA